MERLIVAATVISGDLAGAGFVIAAKGLLRFREIHGSDQPRVDEVTEYFLVGDLYQCAGSRRDGGPRISCNLIFVQLLGEE
jgi:hypothetical protein